MQILRSVEDCSVNWVIPTETGSLEARYVRRKHGPYNIYDDYFICYLSSQVGCRQACRFCHLTATGQTADALTTPAQYIQQAILVLDYYQTSTQLMCPKATTVHFNFMARGEPLLNPHLSEVMVTLAELAKSRGLIAKFKISTIMPKDADLTVDALQALKKAPNVELYYSLYSTCPDWRRAWLPKAMPVDDALSMIKASGLPLALHQPFILGENDFDSNMFDIVSALEKHDLTVKFNVVRYNPPNNKSEETPEHRVTHLAKLIGTFDCISRVRIVPRVGFDVNASCGMFVS